MKRVTKRIVCGLLILSLLAGIGTERYVRAAGDGGGRSASVNLPSGGSYSMPGPLSTESLNKLSSLKESADGAGTEKLDPDWWSKTAVSTTEEFGFVNGTARTLDLLSELDMKNAKEFARATLPYIRQDRGKVGELNHALKVIRNTAKSCGGDLSKLSATELQTFNDSVKTYNNMLDAGRARYLSNSKGYVARSNMWTKAGVALSAYSIYQDCKSLVSESHHKHASMKVIEKGLYIADGVAAGIGIYLAVTAAPVSIPFLVGSMGLSLVTTFHGSEGWANYWNSGGKGPLDKMVKWLDGKAQGLVDWGNSVAEKGKNLYDDLVSSLYGTTKVAPGVWCYKPNIYIYGAGGRTVGVEFSFPGLVTASEPFYPEDGWLVTAADDGTLTDGSGEEYSYLFYEADMAPFLFQTAEGFYLGAQGRAETFGEILRAYGFSEAETADFIQFWDNKLDAGTDYVMYPQGSGIVDAAMPIAIDPLPENIFRLWFVFNPYQGQSFDEASIDAMDREGYAVVEWGGLVY